MFYEKSLISKDKYDSFHFRRYFKGIRKRKDDFRIKVQKHISFKFFA
jgi:hypothetical protein